MIFVFVSQCHALETDHDLQELRIQGNSITTMFYQSVESCHEQCLARTACEAYAHHQRLQMCVLGSTDDMSSIFGLEFQPLSSMYVFTADGFVVKREEELKEVR